MTRKLLTGVAIWLLLCFSGQISWAAEPDTHWRIGETISGRSIRAIQAALPELERRNLALQDYSVSVSELGAFVLVIFGNPEDVAPNRRHTGCAGPRVCVGVTLAAEDFRVVRSGFQK